MNIEPKTFICDSCGEESIAERSEEEVIQEYENNFQRPFNKEDAAAICDDCYDKFMSWYRQQSS